MKIAYFDCFAGASGDMILGALLDAGLDIEQLRMHLAKLQLKDYSIQAARVVKKGISGIKFDVVIRGETDTPHQHHNCGSAHKSGHQPHRHLGDITDIIERSELSEHVKTLSKRIFTRLAEAEAKIHHTTMEKIHFHEVGAVDSIVDIVGAVIALELLGVEKVYASKIHIGTGTVECAHGTLPVPAPATLEILKGTPVYCHGIESELITPTGAVILTTLSESFGGMPAMKPQATGYGAGFHDLPIANLLRVTIGESTEAPGHDAVQLIETNIDDMNPQFYDHIMTRLFEAGAWDVYLNPIIMKKSRPGVILSVIAEASIADACIEIIFSETTTLGVRMSPLKKRTILKREIIAIETEWGMGHVKVRFLESGYKTFEPEYKDCSRLAHVSGWSVQAVYDLLKQKAAEWNPTDRTGSSLAAK